MKPIILKPGSKSEFPTLERCDILEVWNDPNDDAVSIASAKVQKGVTTQLHCLRGINERYVILSGTGIATIGDLKPQEVGTGDVVIIPAGTAQQITNIGDADLIFYCICSPRFTPECYEALGK